MTASVRGRRKIRAKKGDEVRQGEGNLQGLRRKRVKRVKRVSSTAGRARGAEGDGAGRR